MQKTLNRPVTITGVGLHSGKTYTAIISPAPENSGIQLKRGDVNRCDYSRITPYNVSSTQLATTVDCNGFPISTIEHFSAAFYGIGIDNAYVSVSGEEFPILDGSAKCIIDAIEEVGIKTQNVPRKILKVQRFLSIEYQEKNVAIEPYDGFQITFELDYTGTPIGKQIFTYDYNEENFGREIGVARTFGFKEEVEALWSMGLAQGGSLDNAIVVGNMEEGVLNKEGLRFPDEFVRHKILDMFGDLSLMGYRLEGKIHASRSGHQINNIFAKTLLESTNSYTIIDDEEKAEHEYSQEEAKTKEDKVLANSFASTPLAQFL